MTKEHLKETSFYNYSHPSIQAIVNPFKTSELSKKEIAIALYYKIRDDWRYNPYRISFVEEHYQSSFIAQKTDGHCIEKSILLISCLRALNIPAKLHLAKVKNHIGVEKFIEKFGNDEITPHGMVDIYLNEKWVKVSPAFNKDLCDKLNVHPLDFDGENDSLFQEFDKSGNTFMHYLEDYGSFEDVPLDFIANNFKENYPRIMEMSNENGEIKI
jgi:transglutaminase-like putative cysteine protease